MLSVDPLAVDVERNEAMNEYLKTDLDKYSQPAMPSFSLDIPLGQGVQNRCSSQVERALTNKWFFDKIQTSSFGDVEQAYRDFDRDLALDKRQIAREVKKHVYQTGSSKLGNYERRQAILEEKKKAQEETIQKTKMDLEKRKNVHIMRNILKQHNSNQLDRKMTSNLNFAVASLISTAARHSIKQKESMKKLDKIDEDDVSWFRKQTLKDVDLVSLTSKKDVSGKFGGMKKMAGSLSQKIG